MKHIKVTKTEEIKKALKIIPFVLSDMGIVLLMDTIEIPTDSLSK